MRRSSNDLRLMITAGAIAAALAAAPHSLSAGEMVVDGGFESGSFASGWIHGAGRIGGVLNPSFADHQVALDLPYSGSYSALIGFKNTSPKRDRYGFLSYDVSIPAVISSANLDFKFRYQGYDGAGYDPFVVEIRDLAGGTLQTVENFSFADRDGQFKDSGWIDGGLDLSDYAGQSIRVHFRQENRGDHRYATWTFIDDVSAVYRKFVDLTVNSNGEDVFGDIGTGDGGDALLSAEAGETATYDLEIENEGSVSDSYTISASPPSGWAVTINYQGIDYFLPWNTPVIEPGARIGAEVSVTPPAGEPAGSYQTIVDAVSVSAPGRFDSAALGLEVVAAAYITDLVIDGDGLGTIEPGGEGGYSLKYSSSDSVLTYTVDIHNGGAHTDSFRVRFSAEAPLGCVIEEGGVTRTGQFVTGPAAAGDSIPMTLTVTVPAGVSGGDYSTLVFAQSVNDTVSQDGVTAVARVLAPGVDAIICGSGDDIIDPTGSGLGGSGAVGGIAGGTVYFPLVIQNEGALADSFLLEWDSPPGPWSAVITDGTNSHALPWTTSSFDPGSERKYYLAVTIAHNSRLGNYKSILDITSSVDGAKSESVSASIVVVDSYETDLVIDGNGDDAFGILGSGLGGFSSQAAAAQDTVYFQIEVQNEGGEDLFDLEWTTPEGWEVSIGDSSWGMRGIPSGIYTLRAVVPEGCPDGDFDIFIDGMKTNKRYLLDSVTGRVVVLPPNNVDAVIDGNGDGIYGLPESGAGGTSLRSAAGGLAATFTVELQNEGDEAESYTVSWNAIAGWAATFDSGLSPYTTVDIPAGQSGTYLFEAAVPFGTPEGDYDYIIDVVSTSDSTNTESVTARVLVNPPSSIDLVIEGDGALSYGPAGSGAGGCAMVFGSAGATVTVSLEVINNGGAADSFRITWQDPAGWPAGSVTLSDGLNDYLSPFVSAPIAAGGSQVYTLSITVPAGADLRNTMIVDGVSITSGYEDSVLLEIGTGCFITGTVFDDYDHDAALDAGESGWSGVTVSLSDPGGDLAAVTDGGGCFGFEISAGTARSLIERTPGGMISLTPDTVAVPAMAAGDTARIDFADVRTSVITPALTESAPAGGTVDLAHTITAGTPGQATLNAYLPAGWAAAYYRDVNGDGLLDAGDTPLDAAALLLDPATPGSDMVDVIVRVFIPASETAGSVHQAQLVLQQELSGTAISVQSTVADDVLVLASSAGLLDLVKEVDLAMARPGDVVTYTINFSNPGTGEVSGIEIIDPVAATVDLVLDAFGPGQDVAWVTSSGTVYLTADPTDADEAMYDSAAGLLRVELSRRSPFVLNSGESGRIIYRVRIK